MCPQGPKNSLHLLPPLIHYTYLPSLSRPQKQAAGLFPTTLTRETVPFLNNKKRTAKMNVDLAR